MWREYTKRVLAALVLTAAAFGAGRLSVSAVEAETRVEYRDRTVYQDRVTEKLVFVEREARASADSATRTTTTKFRRGCTTPTPEVITVTETVEKPVVVTRDVGETVVTEKEKIVYRDVVKEVETRVALERNFAVYAGAGWGLRGLNNLTPRPDGVSLGGGVRVVGPVWLQVDATTPLDFNRAVLGAKIGIEF